MNAQPPPNIHPCQRLTTPDNKQVDIDTLMVPLVQAPLDDGRRLLNTLLDTPFHDRVSVRWQPGSWRMHVPLVHDEKNRIDLAHSAQIYFPGKQVPELTAVLTDLSAGKGDRPAVGVLGARAGCAGG